MTAPRPMHYPRPIRTALVTRGMILRMLITILAFAAATLVTLPVQARADQTMRLRGDVIATGDSLTLGDLVENAPAAYATRSLFRAPALGATGTIQTRRIVDAALSLDLGPVETGGRLQVNVQRAARRVGTGEIETALKVALEASHGLEARTISIRFEGEAPNLMAAPALNGAPLARDVTFDARTRRVTGLIVLGDYQASLRVAGQAVEMREVALLARSLNRGEAIAAADLTIERRPRDTVAAEAQVMSAALVGQVAQRGLNAGAVLRSGDLAPADMVMRGEAVTIVFETPGIALSLRGIANESGKLGATIAVLNPGSKRVLQATVVGQGRVSVSPMRAPQPLAQVETGPAMRPGVN